MTIGSDGTVSITQPGKTANETIGAIPDRDLINPAGLDARGENLFLRDRFVGCAEHRATGPERHRLAAAGYVEASNVNVVQELVDMIQTPRI